MNDRRRRLYKPSSGIKHNNKHEEERGEGGEVEVVKPHSALSLWIVMDDWTEPEPEKGLNDWLYQPVVIWWPEEEIDPELNWANQSNYKIDRNVFYIPGEILDDNFMDVPEDERQWGAEGMRWSKRGFGTDPHVYPLNGRKVCPPLTEFGDSGLSPVCRRWRRKMLFPVVSLLTFKRHHYHHQPQIHPSILVASAKSHSTRNGFRV